MRSIVVYASAGALCLVVLTVELRLWQDRLGIPFRYGQLHDAGGDTFHLTLFKTISETGWYLRNPRLGAPTGLELGDVPYVETQTFLSAKVLAALIGEPASAFNLHFFLGFLLPTWTALYVFRRFTVPDPVAVAAALQTVRPLAGADGPLYFLKLPGPTTTGTTATIRDRPVEPPPDRPG